MANDAGRLIVVVDTDTRFIEDARRALSDHRVIGVQQLAEALAILPGGRVDLVVLGPAYASDIGVAQARSLFEADSSAAVALVAEVVTTRLLRSALKGGLIDVLGLPLDDRDLAGMLAELSLELAPAVEAVIDSGATPTVQLAEIELPIDVDPGPITIVADPATSPAEPAEVPQPVATVAQVTFAPAEVRSVDMAQIEMAQIDLPPPPQQVTPQSVAKAPVATVADQMSARVVSQQVSAPVVPDTSVPVISQQVLAPVVADMAPPASEEPPTAHEAFALAPPVAPPPDTPQADPIAPEPRAPEPTGETFPPPPSTPPRHDPSPVTGFPQEPRHRGFGSGAGRVIAVMAGKGGSGKTVVATNLAIAIGLRGDPERIAIVDADLQFGDVALMLQIDPVRTIDDIAGRVDSMSDERLDAALMRHESGIRVLPAPLLPVRAGEIRAKSIVEIVDRLRAMYDTIVIDTGPVFDDGLITILEHSDQVVTVVDMDLPSVKNAKVALDGLRGVGFDMDRVRLLVNRANSRARLDLVELERSLGLRVGGTIPSDRLVPRSVNEGIPVLALSPRSKVARSFHALAESMDPSAQRERLNGR